MFKTPSTFLYYRIETIHKYLKEASALVSSSYPKERQEDAMGTWVEEAGASDPERAFAAWCVKRRCLEEVSKGFGAVAKIEDKGEGMVAVSTTRDGVFEMSQADGRWGLAIFAEELGAGKLRALDRLEQIRKNAQEFRQQRAAVGAEDQGTWKKQGERL